jgi:hypothetical protein
MPGGRIAKREGMSKLSLCEFEVGGSDPTHGFWPLNEALANLEELDPRAAKVVELRFSAG